MDDTQVREQVQALDGLLAELEDAPAGATRDAALAAVEGLLAVYGEALARVVHVATGTPALERLAADELVSQLLLLHDLAPATLEERVRAALEEVRPYMGSHGGGIELVEIAGTTARVRLQGTCHSCGASTLTLKLAVEEAVLRAAPELEAVEATEAGAPLPMAATESLPIATTELPMAPAERWTPAGDAEELSRDGLLRRQLGDARLVFVRAGDDLYAYRDRCPACRSDLGEAQVEEGVLRCGGCGRRYDVRRAGVGVDGGLMQLEPVPLLVSDGQARVAVAGAL
ncbi:MAG TPA: NifU family protein [Solirubrobacteraceae bacterium]|nr:NifU family protein [Solirubrobacteraceae bacterium]